MKKIFQEWDKECSLGKHCQNVLSEQALLYIMYKSVFEICSTNHHL